MAFYDGARHQVVVRLVYEGAGGAGKMTNLRQLCSFFSERRRTDVVRVTDKASKDTIAEYLYLEGGLVAGYQLRSQVVVVLGQSDDSRQKLLDSAEKKRAGMDR